MLSSPQHQDRLRQGHELQMQGKLEEAADIYRAVLLEAPDNAPALHLLGVLMMQAGQLERGVEMVQQSLAIMPGFAPAHANLGRGLEQLGRTEEALAAYDRLVQLAPGHPEAYDNRSRVLQNLRRHQEALRDLDKALSLTSDPKLLVNRGTLLLELNRPQDALAAFDKALEAGFSRSMVYYHRGLALKALDRPQEALASCDAALQRQPDYPQALVSRALLLEELQRHEEALAAYEQALALEPGMEEAQANRAALLLRTGRKQEALTALDDLIARHPDNAAAHAHRGLVRKSFGQLEAALTDLDRAVALQPDNAATYSDRGLLLQALGRFEDAMAGFDHAVALDQAWDGARFNKASLLLLQGDFAQGLPLYENRPQPAPSPDIDPAKAWKGLSQDIAGKTMLVRAEQGLGDIIQYSRYLILLHERGARIVLAVHEVMAALLRTLPVPVTIITTLVGPPAHDFHVPLLSLPLLLGTNLQTIPAPTPYLTAEPERAAHWRKRLGDGGTPIGVAWQGSTIWTADSFRSFPLAALAPIAALPGVRLISLQKNGGLEQLGSLPAGMTVETLGDDFDSGLDAFTDTAAVMQACDLVISCDTAIAHLAGALGRPTWLALKDVPECRWQLERNDSPWYPTIRLYRQSRFNQWDAVFAAMARDLGAMLTDRG